MALKIDDLINKKDDILKAEICAYFSLFDKLNISHRDRNIIRQQIFNIPNIQDTNEYSDSNALKKLWLSETESINLSGYEEILKNLLKRSWQWIFWNDCERINSWIDKWNPDAISIDYRDFWLTNAYGFVNKRIDLQNVVIERDNFLNNLNNLTNILLNRSSFIVWVKDLLSLLPSDSRISVADVSLWDQTYMSVSMYKSRLAEIILLEWKDENWILISDFTKTRWKWSIMWIIYDKLWLKENAVKIWMINWYDEKIKELEISIKNLIEEKYCLWNEIYNDETWIYFLVPSCCAWNNILNKEFFNLQEDLAKHLKSDIESKFNEELTWEVLPTIVLTKPSRWTTTLGYLKENIGDFMKGNKRDYKKINEDNSKFKEPKWICKNCKVRLYENENSKLCEECEKLINRAVDSWKPEWETIWMEELCDKNNKIWLMSLKFELDNWLNWELVNSLIVQKKDKNDIWAIIVILKEIKSQWINVSDYKLINEINWWLLLKYYDASSWEEMYNRILAKINVNIANSDFTIKWLKLEDQELLTSLINKSIFRENNDIKWKNPWTINLQNKKIKINWLFSYLYFVDKIRATLFNYSLWNDLEKYLNDTFWSDKINLGTQVIYWDKLTDDDIEKLATLLFQLLVRKHPSPARLRRVWESTERFLNDIWKVLENNCRWIHKEEILKQINKSTAKESIDWKGIFDGDKNKIEDIAKNQFKQYRTILKSPVSYQFIIPADKIDLVLSEIQKKYDEHFGLVKWKLPIHIWVVVQNYKFPLYLWIRALRKIRRDAKNVYDKIWNSSQLYSKNYSSNNDNLKNYYSYFQTTWTWTYKFRIWNQDIELWVPNCKDEFTYYPNTVDFEFLDTNQRRYDIQYDGKLKRKIKLKSNRPYELDEFVTKFVGFRNICEWNSSKIQNLISLVIGKYEDWSVEKWTNIDSFEIFVNTTITKMFKKEDSDKLNNLLKIDEWKIDIKLLLDLFEFVHKLWYDKKQDK